MLYISFYYAKDAHTLYKTKKMRRIPKSGNITATFLEDVEG